MKPLGRNVILEKTNDAPENSSGILLLNADNKNEGKVLAVGADVDEVKAGDVVILDSKVRNPVRKMYGDKTVLVNVDDILCVKE